MADTEQFIDFLAHDGDLHALVMLNGSINGRFAGKTAIGFYRDRQRFLAEVERLNRSGNIYINLNRLNPDVYGRAAERVNLFSQTRFSDAEIARRRALLIDGDVIRVTGINSTDEELEAAIEVIGKVATYLTGLWGIEPLHVMTGNGGGLLYRIDEPADTLLVKQVLTHLHERFSNDRVKIDTSVSDAARITRLPGTLNMKGDDIAGRPQRIARILSVPTERRIVTTEQLLLLAPRPPRAESSVRTEMNGLLIAESSKSLSSPGEWTHGRLRDVLDNQYKGEYRVVTETHKHYDDDTAYELMKCPFDDHGDEIWKTRISLIDGRPGIKCFHNSCSEPKKTFNDFLQLFASEAPLAVTDELRLARQVVTVFSRDSIPTLRYFRGDWYQWDNIWRKLDDAEIVDLLYRVPGSRDASL